MFELVGVLRLILCRIDGSCVRVWFWWRSTLLCKNIKGILSELVFGVSEEICAWLGAGYG